MMPTIHRDHYLSKHLKSLEYLSCSTDYWEYRASYVACAYVACAHVVLLEQALYLRTVKIVLRNRFLNIIELLNAQKYQPDS